MYTLMTPTCSADRYLQVLQSHSIEKFVLEPVTHIIMIEDNKYSIDEWSTFLHPIYKKHKLVLLHKESMPSIFPVTAIQPNLGLDEGKRGHQTQVIAMGGWHRQQLMKLFVSKIVRTPYYLNIDSKNIFIKPTSISEFDVDGSGNIHGWAAETFNDWRPWIDCVSTALNRAPPDTLWWPCTPFNLKTDTVHDMLATLDWEQLFVNNCRDMLVSEYLAYSYFSTATLLDKTRPTWAGGYQLGATAKAMHNYLTYVPILSIGRFCLKNYIYRANIANFLIDIGLPKNCVTTAIQNTDVFNR